MKEVIQTMLVTMPLALGTGELRASGLDVLRADAEKHLQLENPAQRVDFNTFMHFAWYVYNWEFLTRAQRQTLIRVMPAELNQMRSRSNTNNEFFITRYTNMIEAIHRKKFFNQRKDRIYIADNVVFYLNRTQNKALTR